MEDLIRRFVDEELINGRHNLMARLDEGHSILNKLKNNNLLQARGDALWLHHMVGAMAINNGKESHGYMCKTEFPDEREWEEDLQKISLISDEITEIPFGMSPKCPRLSTLRMRRMRLEVIPDNFFTSMPSLKMLDLSDNACIAALPLSISNLECLTVLLLGWCESLRHIPSLAKLKQLRRLDLSCTAITQVPLGFENLPNLRWLQLEGTAVMKAQYLERLPMLESIGATFVDKDEFNACVQIIQARINSGLMKSYFLRQVGDAIGVPCEDGISHNIDSDKTIEIDGVHSDIDEPGKFVFLDDINIGDKTIEINGTEHSKLLLPSDINVLEIKGCNQWRSLCDVLSIQQSNNELHISTCDVYACDKLEYLFCSSVGCTLCFSLQGLNELRLGGLDSLSMLWKENEAASSFMPFSHLTKLSIRNCGGMKKLLTPGMSTQLHNLEEIDVDYCKSMEEIFSTEKSRAYEVEMDDNNVEAINLPKLKSVSLRDLPRLKSVCRGVIKCASLKYFYIYNCPKLKCVPQTQPPFDIQVTDRSKKFQ